MRSLLYIALVVLIGCSFTHQVVIDNASNAPVTIAYKIRPASWQHGLFHSRPLIQRKAGKETVLDTTTRMNRMDSVITFTLGPGDEATLGWCINCTLEVLTRDGLTDPWAEKPDATRMNLYWMRIEQRGTSTTYGPKELVAFATKNKAQRTLIRLKD